MAHKIVIAEDDVILREILVDKLSAAGYKALGAADGAKALDLVRGEHPDLVLLDIMIPVKNGIEVLAEIRADSSIATTPVVAISNSDDAESIRQAQSLGVRDFLIKAIFDSNDVLEKIRQILGGATQGNPKPPVTAATATSTQAKPSPEAAGTGKTAGGKKVLIVEDDRFLREIATQKLEAEGLTVISATGGKEAVDHLNANERPDIIVLDLILPGMSGFEVLEKIKQNESLKNIPVIILSNLGQEEDIEKAKKLGAVDYLVKAHFSFAEIIKKIHDVIG
jgi:two-component system, sensor histidine kinase and response regulator